MLTQICPELGFFNVRVDPNLARADLRDDSRVDPRNSGQDSSYSRVNSWTKWLIHFGGFFDYTANLAEINFKYEIQKWCHLLEISNLLSGSAKPFTHSLYILIVKVALWYDTSIVILWRQFKSRLRLAYVRWFIYEWFVVKRMSSQILMNNG